MVDKKKRRARKAEQKTEKRVDETSYLTGKRRGACLREEVWYEGREVVKYSLAYINHRRCPLDNGRVLGYDNNHGRHHRHYMGDVEEVDFRGYEQLVNRFQSEVYELWRVEDEENG
jgi:Family of unknown function (DUF6516)